MRCAEEPFRRGEIETLEKLHYFRSPSPATAFFSVLTRVDVISLLSNICHLHISKYSPSAHAKAILVAPLGYFKIIASSNSIRFQITQPRVSFLLILVHRLTHRFPLFFARFAFRLRCNRWIKSVSTVLRFFCLALCAVSVLIQLNGKLYTRLTL